ncbi:MAG: class I SAM-dependent methyltransferase [Desulfarculaceae bacterium]|nr:class I SAM-dependent methyltransferase [Desulfarculaceae bacterium]MCF8072109.1 class I SAM-dependent methyltransferase [Desulfarculaceae bacterium]MCF8100030.1 class I SAM-dependent methyltransferase [Desulfarculaceae bacterium]
MPLTVSHAIKNRLLSLNGRPILRRLFQVIDSSPTPDPQFWRDTAYHGQQGSLRLRLLGVPLLSLSYSMSLEDVYAKRGNPHLEKGLEDLVAAEAVEPVTQDSLVLDSGCNVGAWLRYLAGRYGCRVCGVDISQEAIEFAREITFPGDERAEFHCQDVLAPGFFERFPDGHFSHVFCMSHLVHLPSGPAKEEYIAQLKRVGRNVVFYERMPMLNRPEPANRHAEDFTGYGFRVFRKVPKANPEKFMGIYYWRPGW